jgi:FixJ family two-component response regulator
MFKAGASDFIRKPFVPAVAIQRVNRVVEWGKMKALLDQSGIFSM